MKKNILSKLIIILYLLALLPFQGVDVYAQSSQGKKEDIKDDVPSFGETTVRGINEPESTQIAPLPSSGPGASNTFYYNVHVLGEVVRPGKYRILPSDRVTDALFYAGGILSNGSTRTIQLRRQENTRVVDIFSYKYQGWLSQNPYLMENDVIFVPLKNGEVQVEGPVNRPGTYEIMRSISLKSLVQLAGGFSAGRSLKEPIRVVRFSEDEEKEIIQIENSEKELRSFIVQKGDVIVVPHMLLADKSFDFNVKRIPGDNIFYPTINDNVYVIGAVTNPGPYQFQPSFSHNDYVSLAGPNETASLRRVKVITSDGKKKYIKRGYEVNPGDTIVVPTKSVSTANILAWFNTITSSTLTSLLIYNQVK